MCDIPVRATDTANSDLDIGIRQKIFGEFTDRLGTGSVLKRQPQRQFDQDRATYFLKCRAEHENLLVVVLIGISALEELADLRLKSHVQHFIRLIDNNEPV